MRSSALLALLLLGALGVSSSSLDTTASKGAAPSTLPSEDQASPSVNHAKRVVGKGGGIDCSANDDDMYCDFIVGLDSSLCAMGGSVGDFMMTFCPGSCGACDTGNGVCVVDNDANMASVAAAFGYGFVTNCDQALSTHQNAFGTEGCEGPFSSVLNQNCPCSCYEEPEEEPCVPPLPGIQFNLSRTDSSLAGFVETLNVPYGFSDATMLYEPESGECVFVGALPRANSTVFALGAFGHRDVVFNTTTSTTVAENFDNGVYFYNRLVSGSGSFGFAAVPEISLSTADIASTFPESRMSWHYSSGGVLYGYRAGTNFLNLDNVWRKVVLTGPCACSNVPEGIVYNHPVSSSVLSRFTTFLDIPYNDNREGTYEPPAALGNCVFIGAKSSSASTEYHLGAFGRIDAVYPVQTQDSIAENFHNGVYFYNFKRATGGGSFGFAGVSSVRLNSADISSSEPDSRLSWHYSGAQHTIQYGYRAGNVFLNSDATWRKVVLVGSCDL